MEYRVGLLLNRATVVGDDSSRERMLLGSFVSGTKVHGNETSRYHWSELIEPNACSNPLLVSRTLITYSMVVLFVFWIIWLILVFAVSYVVSVLTNLAVYAAATIWYRSAFSTFQLSRFVFVFLTKTPCESPGIFAVMRFQETSIGTFWHELGNRATYALGDQRALIGLQKWLQCSDQ